MKSSDMKLYSKRSVTEPISAMSRTGRFVHSYIITGDEGVGKKTAAKYIAMQLLCDNKNACGSCRQCSRIIRGQHPDFITVEKEGRIYTVNDIRTKVVDDSYTAPNDCDRKVYLLPDCEGWTDASQDALLKITEDPPETAYFIFTARNRSFFLPTLISRSMVIDISEADRESCAQALRDHSAENSSGFTEEKIAEATSAFGGNIGRCIDFLEGNDKLMKAAEAVRSSVDAIIARDEYTLAVILNSISSDRSEMRDMLEMLARALRDGAVIKSGGKDTVGCTAAGSAKMAERISVSRLLSMYDAVCEASYRCTRNCNTAAAAAVLAGKLCR